VSHYNRAQQSYQQLCQKVVIQGKQVSSDVLPGSNPQLAHDYIKVLIAETPGLKSILVVSHMPFISYFLEEIHEKNESMLFETSSIAIVDYNPVESSGTLVCVYHPG
jgi:phosphohistidine phosphatase